MDTNVGATALLEPPQPQEIALEDGTPPYFKDGFDLGVDIDGVLTDTHGTWTKFFNHMAKDHGHDPQIIPYLEDVPSWGYHENICKECYNSVLYSNDLARNYPVVDKAEEIMYWLTTLGVRIHLITARPESTKLATEAWAKERFGALITSVSVTTNKLEVASARHCKYHIEDSPQHIRAFQTQKQILPIIYTKPFNLSLEGFRVKDWVEIGTFLMWKENRP